MTTDPELPPIWRSAIDWATPRNRDIIGGHMAFPEYVRVRMLAAMLEGYALGVFDDGDVGDMEDAFDAVRASSFAQGRKRRVRKT